jgi:putative peptide zinc metalloprotease protein
MDRLVTMSAANQSPVSPKLPELRQDLRVERAASDASGTECWLIVDSTQHRYVQIDVTAYRLLSRWQSDMTYQALADCVVRDFGHQVSSEEIGAFVNFIAQNHFLAEPVVGGWRHYASSADRTKSGWLMWLVHNYLFVKIPLFRPELFLKRALPMILPLFSRKAAFLVGTIGLIGIYLVSRQWDAFLGTFQHFFSWQGALIYGVALILIKSAHELGHAFTAVRFGCRVPSMGVCLLVMFPVLYTDVTDAWRLRDRHQRLAIGAAGVTVELAIACCATFLWSFLPEGSFKSLAFSLATVGWVLSLVINLNPLMRFDGYYLFSDFLGIDNLQSRAFAFGQWRLRETLFGLGRSAPESLPRRTQTILVAYAWAVWVYRVILFTGIALLVYHMTFKILGIVLFLIEIGYFVVRPIAHEISVWRNERSAIVSTRRTKWTLGIALGSLVLAVVPWSSKVSVPAILEASEIARVFPQRSGLVEKIFVEPGAHVTAGSVMVQLSSAETDHQIALTKQKIALQRMRLARRASDELDRSNSLVLEQELHALSSALKGLLKERGDLSIVAPHAGTVAEFNSGVHSGRAIHRSELIALIRGSGSSVVRGYIAEDDVRRLGGANSGRFIPDTPGLPTFDVRLNEIAHSGAAHIEMPELTSSHGGAIAVRPHAGEGGRHRLVPVNASYLVTMSVVSDPTTTASSIRGVAVLEGEPQSFAGKIFRQVAAVLVRESGF